MKRLLLILPLALLIGCAAVNHTDGVKIDSAKVAELTPGKTTKQDVITTFGAPSSASSEGNVETLTYRYSEKRGSSLLGGTVEYVPSNASNITTLTVTITDNVVTAYKYSASEK